MRRITHAEWITEGRERFKTENVLKWKFVCPVCGVITTGQEWKDAGAPSGALAFSCVGRWLDNQRKAFGGEGLGPCDYAGGGLFTLNPVQVVMPDGSEHQAFEFA